jgi:hypothetical protein
MSATVHEFADKLARGACGARVVVDHLVTRGWYDFRPATRDEEWSGKDYVCRHPDGRELSVEVKTDDEADRTGNAFVEGISNDRTGRLGWAVTCSADLLFYYVTGAEAVYILRPRSIREALPRWSREYRTRPAHNDGYRTHGLLVPLHEFEALAIKVVSL